MANVDFADPLSPIGGGYDPLTDAFAPVSISKNGTPVGSLTSIEVDQNGFVRVIRYWDQPRTVPNTFGGCPERQQPRNT